MNHNNVQLSIWQTRITPSSLRIALALIISLILAYQIAIDQRIGPALVFGGLAFIILFMEPIICFYAILILTFINPNLLPILFNIGNFHFRIVDIFYFLLITRLLFEVIIKGFNQKIPSIFKPLAIFVFYIGLGLFKIALVSPNHFLSALASYSRLLETGLLIPIAYWIFSTEKKIRFLIIFLIFLSVISITIGGWTGYSELSSPRYDGRSIRTGGVLGINSLGLISGLMVLLAIIFYGERKRLYCLLPGLFGLVGLLLSKSASSLVGTIITIMWYFFYRKNRRGARAHIKLVVSLILSLAICIFGVSLLRPVDFQSAMNMEEGSFSHRVYLANVGWRIFLNNPLMGVGWQLSSEPEIIGDPDVNTYLRARYNRFNFRLFTDITPTSVHNMYIQLLAELGLIGLCLFIWIIKRVKQTKNTIMHNIRTGNLKSYTQFLTLSLLFLLIWWNTNPLFPGQIETMLACIFVGVLAAIGTMTAQYKQPWNYHFWMHLKMGPKILHIINALSPGGAELHLLTLCREQKRQGLEVTVACLKERAPGVTRTLRHDFEAAGFPVIHLQTDSRYDCRFLYKLPTFLAREKFSLLHSHLPRADLAGAWASFLRPALPWLCSIHDIHSNSWSAKWVLPGFTRVWNRADAIIAISGAVKDWLVREHRVPGAKITVIHYGIETERFSRPGSDLRQALGLDGQPVIGSIGRLEPRKGHDVLIRAMLAVLKEIPEATLLIAGPDMWGYGRNLQQLIDTLGLNGRVRLLGFQEDIPSFLQALDVFAFASKSEGFGQVILEAMAAGKPVVASRVAPLTEIVLDGETGWLAHPEDAGDFSRAVIRLLKLPQEACQLGEQAARRVREQFTTRRMADQTLEIYESLFRKQQ